MPNGQSPNAHLPTPFKLSFLDMGNHYPRQPFLRQLPPTTRRAAEWSRRKHERRKTILRKNKAQRVENKP
jgi:hypothetical protein